MKLNEILGSGFVSYYGDEMDGVSITAFRTEKQADGLFRRLNKDCDGTDAVVLKAETQNGYHLVGVMDWKELSSFSEAHFIAFGPTLSSCQQLTVRLIKDTELHISEIHYTEVAV